MWSAKRILEGYFNFEDTSSASTFLDSLSPAPAPASTFLDSLSPAPAPASTPLDSLNPAPAPASTFLDSLSPAMPAPASTPLDSLNPAMHATMTDKMSLTLLQDLIRRIDEEAIALKNLADQNTTVIAKQNQLASLRDELSGYVRQLQTSPPQMRVEDIPVSVEAIQNFLQFIGPSRSTTQMYPDLFNVAKPPATATTTIPTTDSWNMEQAQDLFKHIQYVKWRFEVSYDPALSQKTNLLDRLESLEKRIMEYAQSGKPMPDSMKQVLTRELELITSVVKNTKLVPDAPVLQGRPAPQNTRMQTAASYKSDGRTYTAPDQYVQQGTYSLFDGVPQDSSDVRIRPGFVMTSEQIRHRGSAAAFNTQAVGGPDYKKRAEELCRQIRGANIGAPADFGCIENANEVSANYSWKGNYAMVCNRLGDTWGSWYPEMFGCPKYNPDDQYNGNLL